jgi:hypothetical protein
MSDRWKVARNSDEVGSYGEEVQNEDQEAEETQ